MKKMPLGKLSQTQIAKGFEALVELEEAIKSKKVSDSKTLSFTYEILIHALFR